MGMHLRQHMQEQTTVSERIVVTQLTIDPFFAAFLLLLIVFGPASSVSLCGAEVNPHAASEERLLVSMQQLLMP